MSRLTKEIERLIDDKHRVIDVVVVAGVWLATMIILTAIVLYKLFG